jgi:vacuolar-type H+-ATPase subunit I/STV1
MPEENVEKFEEGEGIVSNKTGKEKAIAETGEKLENGKMIEEKFFSPEKKQEIEKRKEIIEKQEQEAEKAQDLSEEEKETVKGILVEAKKTGALATIPNTETISDRLITSIIEGGQKLKHVLRAVKEINDPFLFDTFRDKLTEDETWQKLKETGEI